jgi:phosphoribulokinase
MSKKHPLIVVTGSSGAGTSSVKQAFQHIFSREGLNAAVIEGDSYHKYSRVEMRKQFKKADKAARTFSHFGPEANLFEELEQCFKSYSETGTCRQRYYIHNLEEQELHGVKPGNFTEWQDVPPGTDLLFYEGLHGCIQTDTVDLSKYADLKVGVTPSVNLEWIQKIHRDSAERGHEVEAVTDTILRRMYDYVNYITPQFARTDINFQRVPVVDTSHPFMARDIPSPDESLVVIRFAQPRNWDIDLGYYLERLDGSWMSRQNTIVVPGGKMSMAMEMVMLDMLNTLGIIEHIRR